MVRRQHDDWLRALTLAKEHSNVVVRLASAPGSIEAVNIVGRRASEKGCRLLHRGNEKREKQNFRVRFLHTMARKYVIFFKYLPNPVMRQLIP